MKHGRIALALGLAIIVIPVFTAAGLILSFNPQHYAPQIIAALESVSGRQVTLGAPIKLQLSLTPTLSVQDVSVLNPSGFASPKFLHLDELRAKFALLPLLSHRLDIMSLELVNPQINLSTLPSGQADWDFSPPAAVSSASGAPLQPPTPHRQYKISLQTVRILNGRMIFQNGKTGQIFVILVSNLSGTAVSAAAPLHVTAAASFDGVPFSLSGTTGPVERFSGLGSGPWPINLALTAAGLSAHVQGSIAQPRTGRGFDFRADMRAASLAVLLSHLPIVSPGAIPPLQNVTASARIIDQGSMIPAIDDFSLQSGQTDLSSWRPELALNSLTASMASLGQPLEINAAGTIDNKAWTISGRLGAPQAFINPAWLPASVLPQSPYPITLQLSAGAATVAVSGAIATPANLAGVALGVNASIPDLSLFSPLTGSPLPAWKNIALQTTLVDPGGLGLNHAWGLDNIAVTMDHASFGGEAQLFFNPGRNLQAAIQAQNVNLDALLAAFPAAQRPLAPAGAAMTATTPPVIQLIPDTAFPLAFLRTGNADIQASADSLIYRQTDYRSIQSHAVLANGVLTVNPVTGELPGGGVNASVTLDASKEPAAASISITAPALALSPLLKSFNLPDTAEGTVQAVINAAGTGDSAHQLAATMNGQMGIAMVNGIVDSALFDRLLGAIFQSLGLPAILPGNTGPVPVRCFAFRMDSRDGLGTISALTLDSPQFLIQGGGTVNFGTEALGIILQPEIPIAGSERGVPVAISGSFAAPTLVIAPRAAGASATQAAAGLAISAAQKIFKPNTLLGMIANSVPQAAPIDVCPAALALGRLGRPGPPASPLITPATNDTAAPSSGPKSLLNALFGK